MESEIFSMVSLMVGGANELVVSVHFGITNLCSENVPP